MQGPGFLWAGLSTAMVIGYWLWAGVWTHTTAEFWARPSRHELMRILLVTVVYFTPAHLRFVMSLLCVGLF